MIEIVVRVVLMAHVVFVFASLVTWMLVRAFAHRTLVGSGVGLYEE